jgi:hypothetical protein
VIGNKYNGPVFRKALMIDKGNRGSEKKIAVSEEEIENVDRDFVCFVASEPVAQPLYGLEDDEGQKEEKIKQRAKDVA